MKECAPDHIRNFVLAGMAGSGKTSLAELMLFKAGAISRLGSVDAGTTVSDYRKEEQDKKCSIYSSALHCTWKGCAFHFMDTPGSTDYCGEQMNAIAAADMLILVVDSSTGIGPGTMRAWRQARDLNLPRCIFINDCDKDEADFDLKLDLLRQTCVKKTSVPFTIPKGLKANLSGVSCVLDGGEAASYRTDLVESIAESDDALMEKWMEKGDLADEDILKGLHHAVVTAKMIPIFAGSVLKDIGVTELMDFIVNYGPSPVDVDLPQNFAAGEVVRDGGDAVGYVFKSVTDTFIGQMSYVRVLSGTFRKDAEVLNTTRQGKERLGNLFLMQGKNQEAVEEAGPGEILALPKLKATGMLDVLASKETELKVAPPNYPQANTMFAISAVNKGEDDKLAAALQRMMAEDLTIKLERNHETHQTIISGMGDQQIAMIVARMKNDFKIDVALDTPKVPYRETVKSVGQAEFRHKKQSGGHGQFAEVHLRIEPFAGTVEEEYQFGNEVVGGAIPKNFIPAVEKGVAETRLTGPLSHSKVINFRAVVFDGKYHDVDSSEMAFKIATRGAFRAAMANAKPELLEPIFSLTLEFPDEYMGTIQGDLNSRRGRILGLDRQDGMQVLNAEVPLAEVFTYPAQLRSMTQGRGAFTMKFERYEPVPALIAKKIQEAAAAEEKDEE